MTLSGWMPIYIAAVVGATAMILTGCLTADEAYREIEWRAVFLIAGMLPLGIAMDKTGAALFVSEGDVMDVLGQKVVRMYIEGREIDLDNRHKELFRKYQAKQKATVSGG